MRRWLLASMAACLAIVAAGCRMCADPYDECGPMADSGCSQQCGSNARAGSILSGRLATPVIDPRQAESDVMPPSDTTIEPIPEPQEPIAVNAAPSDGWKPSKSAQTPGSDSY